MSRTPLYHSIAKLNENDTHPHEWTSRQWEIAARAIWVALDNQRRKRVRKNETYETFTANVRRDCEECFINLDAAYTALYPLGE
jgi:hypothetical protein